MTHTFFNILKQTIFPQQKYHGLAGLKDIANPSKSFLKILTERIDYCESLK
jgi:hypothetical protein